MHPLIHAFAIVGVVLEIKSTRLAVFNEHGAEQFQKDDDTAPAAWIEIPSLSVVLLQTDFRLQADSAMRTVNIGERSVNGRERGLLDHGQAQVGSVAGKSAATRLLEISSDANIQDVGAAYGGAELINTSGSPVRKQVAQLLVPSGSSTIKDVTASKLESQAHIQLLDAGMLHRAATQSMIPGILVLVVLLAILFLAVCFLNQHQEVAMQHSPPPAYKPLQGADFQTNTQPFLGHTMQSRASMGFAGRESASPSQVSLGRATLYPQPAATLSPSVPASSPQSLPPNIETPQALCPNLILPNTEARFMVDMESLVSGNVNTLDIIGLSGMKLLDASVQITPDGKRNLVLTSVGIQDLCTCSFTPDPKAAGPKVIEVYGRGGKHYGTLELPASGGGILKCSGRPDLFIEVGNPLDLEMSAYTAEHYALAWANRIRPTSADTNDIWRLQVHKNIDAVLIAACMLSMILLRPEELGSRPSRTPSINQSPVPRGLNPGMSFGSPLMA